MLENLKLKTILPLTVACLMVASGVYAGNPGDRDAAQDGFVSPKRSLSGQITYSNDSNGEVEHCSKKQKNDGSFEEDSAEIVESNPLIQIVDPKTLSAQTQNVLGHILSYLPLNDILKMRLTNKRLSLIATDVWKQRAPQFYPHVNFSQVWVNGPESGTFYNAAVNLVIHGIQVEFGALCPAISRYRQSVPSVIFKNIPKLQDIAHYYPAVGAIHRYFDDISSKIWNRQPLLPYLQEIGPRDLQSKGEAEKRLLQFFHFLNGTPLVIDSVENQSEPQPLVQLISDELALRRRILQTPANGRPPLFEELIANGVYLTTQDFRNAGETYFDAQHYEQAIRHFETVLTRPDVTLDDWISAAGAYATLADRLCKKREDINFLYEKFSHYYLIASQHPNVTIEELREIVEELREWDMFDEFADICERLVTRPDSEIEDMQLLVDTSYDAKRFANSARYAEAILNHPGATEENKRKAECDLARAKFSMGEFEKSIEIWGEVEEDQEVAENVFAALHYDFEGAAEKRRKLWDLLGLSDNEAQVYLEWIGHPSDVPYQGKITKTPDELRLTLEKLYKDDRYSRKVYGNFRDILCRILFVLEFQAGNKEMVDSVIGNF